MNTKLAAVATGLLALSAAACTTGWRLDPAIERVTFATEHFDVAAAGVDPDVARRIAAHAEQTWRLYATELEASPSRALLVLFPTHAHYAAAGVPADGLYLPGELARILVPVDAGANVLRHEIAHHFGTAILGAQPEWINEGLAEYLENVRDLEGRPVISGLAPLRLAGDGSHGHGHIDYAAAWRDVAYLIETGRGTLRERVDALPDRSDRAPADWRLPERWIAELRQSLLFDRDAATRIAAARALSDRGHVGALRESLETERIFGVRLAVSTELARAGEKGPLRELAPRIACPHALSIVSRSAGRGFDSVDELQEWLR
jgi:hypothetical protein